MNVSALERLGGHGGAEPMRIGRVVLTVRDIGRVGAFYEIALGLERMCVDGESATYGVGTTPMLELRADRAARLPEKGEAGLFHAAFLLPDRADLARWMHHARAAEIDLQGASDHGVSEAVYLADPEGNGIEVYVDRPRALWPRSGNELSMMTAPLDLPGLMAESDDRWRGAPEGTIIGHLHLSVGDLAAAESFFRDVLGLRLTQRYPGAVFFAAGDYHHHVAGNVWHSRGAGPRRMPVTGLAEWEFLLEPAFYDDQCDRAGGKRVRDPSGTPVCIRAMWQ